MKKKENDSEKKLQFVLVWVLPPKRRWLFNHDKKSISTSSQDGAKTMPEDQEAGEEQQLGKAKKDSD
jgi:hypothetical protein